MNASILKRSFCSIPTKDFRIRTQLGKEQHVRVNKFGVHDLQLKNLEDTGLGFAYSSYDNKSLTSTEYLKETIVDKDVKDYIQHHNMEHQDDIKGDHVVKIKVVNHAYPLVGISSRSKIFIDGDEMWNADSEQNITVQPLPPQNILNGINTEHMCDYELKITRALTSVQYNLTDIRVPGNNYYFIFDKYNIFTDQGLYFSDSRYNVDKWIEKEEDIKREKEREKLIAEGNEVEISPEEKMKIEWMERRKRRKEDWKFLPHGPGGLTNIGTWDSGDKWERWLPADGETTLTITISPALAIDACNRNRYPPVCYPFVESAQEINETSALIVQQRIQREEKRRKLERLEYPSSNSSVKDGKEDDGYTKVTAQDKRGVKWFKDRNRRYGIMYCTSIYKDPALLSALQETVQRTCTSGSGNSSSHEKALRDWHQHAPSQVLNAVDKMSKSDDWRYEMNFGVSFDYDTTSTTDSDIAS